MVYYDKKKYKKAVKRFKKSIKIDDNPNALFVMGNMFADGIGVERDAAKADSYYKAAEKRLQSLANKGNTDAQVKIGDYFYFGIAGKTKSYTTAFDWYKKAAESGSGEGAYRLGNCYLNAQGILKDSEKAAHWYKKSAERGFAMGQCAYADCCYTGVGVGIDYGAAVNWYRKAADQGSETAKKELEKIDVKKI
jgi:TPR repeat protein